MSHYYDVLSTPQFNKSRDDERRHDRDNDNEGDSNYAMTSGDEINYIEAFNKWTQWWDALAESMFKEWQSRND